MKIKQILLNLSFSLLLLTTTSTQVMASGQKNYALDRWVKNPLLSDPSMSQAGVPQRGRFVVHASASRVEPLAERYDDIDESVSTMDAYVQIQARLIDDPEIRRHIKRLYLNIVPSNYEDLHQQAQSFFKKGMFNRFDGGVWIKCEGGCFNTDTLLTLTSAMHNVTKYRISLNNSYSSDAAVDIIAETICGFTKLKEIDLSGCGLNDKQLREVLDSVTSLNVETLTLTDNRLTTNSVPIIQRKFRRLQELQTDFSTDTAMDNMAVGFADITVSTNIKKTPERNTTREEELALQREKEKMAAEKEALARARQEIARKQTELEAKAKAEEDRKNTEQATLNKQKKELEDTKMSLAEQERQVVSRPIAVPTFARAYEAIYNRFINGKLLFDNENGQRKGFSFNQFADTLSGEFDLSGLKYKYDGKMKDVNEYLRIKVGVRTTVENEEKATIWFTPKFMVDRLRSHPWKGVAWSSDVGIFWSWGKFELNDFAYLISLGFGEISSKNLYECWRAARGWVPGGCACGGACVVAFVLNFS